jgi:hypothetical protein
MVQTAERTYLVSTRFGRMGQTGRRHVVSVGAAHAGWVKGSYENVATQSCQRALRTHSDVPPLAQYGPEDVYDDNIQK